MTNATLFLEKIGQAFLFKRFRPRIRDYLFKAGFEEVPYEAFGILFFLGVVLTVPTFLFVIYHPISNLSAVSIGILSFLGWVFIQLLISFMLFAIMYFYYNIKIYKRTQELEDRLPDYLTLVSTNLKGGLSFEKSLWTAIKPEFGILAKEITIVSKKVMTGNDVTEALTEFANKYESPILRRSMNLLIGEIESGGKITQIIDKIIENLRKTRALKAEMAAATVSYMIFIGVIVTMISPGLFALSAQLLRIIIGFTSSLTGAGMGASPIPMKFGEASIKPEHFRIFSMLAIGTIAVFSSMIISIIEKGSIRGGLKYIPAFLIGSLLVYLIMSAVLQSAFAGIAMG
ncbi:MAG: type II secretion system F family protein [Nanoarchaeota archaeon]|nr:type II secretion system F family protein [Nanoarchaeota archaeon]